MNGRIRRFALLGSIGLCVLAAGMLLDGCSSTNPYSGGSLERAIHFRDRDKPREAAEAFGMFIRRSPTDSLAAWAQLEKGKCYADLKEYPLAVVEYQILRQEYPISELVEDAIYLEAQALLAQVDNIHRDISPAIDARIRFRTYIDMYPMSTYTQGAREALQTISDIIVRKNLEVARTYRSMGEHAAAAIMLDRLMDTEGDSSLMDQVYLLRARTALKLHDAETADSMLEKLTEEFPGSDLLNEMKGIREELEPDDAS